MLGVENLIPDGSRQVRGADEWSPGRGDIEHVL
jgi:hypothetical protein